MNSAITLDAGPLILLDKNHRGVAILLERARMKGDTVIVPATALAQAIRNPARQARLARLIRQPRTAVIPLDRDEAAQVGRLLGASGTADIADAHVAICAQRSGSTVITTDPDDLAALAPELNVVVLQ